MIHARKVRSENIQSKRRDQILETAFSVFSSKGFNGSSTVEIATKAGISQGTIFHYYQTKHDLFMAVIEKYSTGESFNELLQNRSHMDTVTVITEFLKNRLQNTFTNIDNLMILISEIQRDNELREYYQKQIIEPLIDIVGEPIRVGVKSRKIRSLDIDLITRMIMGLIAGMALIYKLEGKDGKLHEMPVDLLSREIAEIVIKGIEWRDI